MDRLPALGAAAPPSLPPPRHGSWPCHVVAGPRGPARRTFCNGMYGLPMMRRVAVADATCAL
eukprot:6300994-Prymnesium_polylepis.1